jgi:hypothetical protein
LPEDWAHTTVEAAVSISSKAPVWEAIPNDELVPECATVKVLMPPVVPLTL